MSFGLPAFILVKILVVPFFANEDTKTPIKVSIFSMIINLILNLILITKYLHVGLAIATSVSAWINAMVLFMILIKRKIFVFELSILNVFFKVCMCSLIMGLLVNYFIGNSFINSIDNPFNLEKNVIFLLTIFFAILSYVIMIYLSNIKEVREIKWNQKN